MSFEKLKDFIKLAKDENVAELKYEDKDKKFFVSFTSASAPVVTHSTPISTSPSPIEANMSPEAKSDGFHNVTSPFVGTFYASSAPGKPAYVSVGDRVSKGQTLCILEAMKIMNEIESDVDGEIVEICVGNESLVEYGQTLFKIKA